MGVFRVSAIGDSITANCSRDLVFGGVPPRSWAQWVAADTGAELEVFAKSGADSAEILGLLPDRVSADLVFVFAGVNNTLSWRRYRTVDLAATLGGILSRIDASRVVVVQVPEWLGAARVLAPYGPGLRARIRRNRAIIDAAAEQYGAELVELPELPGDRLWLDGVHPTSTGHRAIADHIEAVLGLGATRAGWEPAETRPDMRRWRARESLRFAARAPLAGAAGWLLGR